MSTEHGAGRPTAVRLAHFSDVHVTAQKLGWSRRDWFSKRLTGYINYRWLGRKFRFRRAEEVTASIVADMRERRPDHMIFSGDATALGFEAEFARAAHWLGVRDPDMPPGFAVPGNHDYYTHSGVAAGLFERYFEPWQQGERVDHCFYPFARRVGNVWLIGVNSCVPNRWTWDATGRVGRDQLDRLEQLLKRLGPGVRILVTHYPVSRGNGKPELFAHNLKDVADVVTVAAAGSVSLWLHGHRHRPYHLMRSPMAPFPIICAGSATQSKLWSYSEYLIEGDHLRATRRVFCPKERRFRDGVSFEMNLPQREESVVD